MTFRLRLKRREEVVAPRGALNRRSREEHLREASNLEGNPGAEAFGRGKVYHIGQEGARGKLKS